MIKKKNSKMLFASLMTLMALGIAGCNNQTSESTSKGDSTSPSLVPSVSTSTKPSTSETPKPSTSEKPSESASTSLVPEHECAHICVIDGKCMDDSCTDDKCKDKCLGHTISETATILEAENGIIEGIMTGTAADDAFIGARDSNNDAHPTSGGKVVFNWAAKGNTVTWNFKLKEAMKTKITLWCCAGQNQSATGLGLKVNGQAYNWKEDVVLGKGFSENKWYYWNPITVDVELTKGINKVVLSNESGESWNLDSLTLEKYVEPVHKCEHVCPECGKCTDLECTDDVCKDKCLGHVKTNDFILEAENGKIAGTMTGSGADDAFIGERNSDNPDHPTSGGKVVFNWAKKDNSITWYVNSSEALENVKVTLWCCAGSDQDSSGLSLLANGAASAWNESKVLGKGFSENKWYYWNPITTTINLNEGMNTIKLVNNGDNSWNIDNLVLAVKEGATLSLIHVCDHICDECGKCTDLSCTDAACADKCPGHSLAFVDGVARIECENYDSADSGITIGNAGENEELSGGKLVGDFNSQRKVTYKVTLKEATTVYLNLRVACGINGNDNGAVELHVNGTKIGNYGTKTDWHDWATVESAIFTLNKGENTIILQAPYGSYTNLDYFDIIKVNAFNEGKMRLEAENCTTNSGATINADGTVGDFGYPDYIEFEIFLKEEVTVTMKANVACGLNGSDNGAIEVHVNGTKIGNYGAVTGWSDYQEVTTASFKLNKGKNTIKIACPWGSATNLDYFDLIIAA